MHLEVCTIHKLGAKIVAKTECLDLNIPYRCSQPTDLSLTRNNPTINQPNQVSSTDPAKTMCHSTRFLLSFHRRVSFKNRTCYTEKLRILLHIICKYVE